MSRLKVKQVETRNLRQQAGSNLLPWSPIPVFYAMNGIQNSLLPRRADRYIRFDVMEGLDAMDRQ